MTSSTAATRKLNRKRRWGPWALFLKGFLKHPVMVGSIIPSTDTLIRHMLSRVDWGACKLFVEYGPGVGTFTQQILDHLAPDATYVAIDLNPDFIDYLTATVVDSRFRPILGSAADVEQIVRDSGFTEADYVLSGLPFSTLPAGVGPAIAAATARVLRPGGAFLVYQYRAKVREFLDPHFARIDKAIEYRNLPPCFLFWAWKDAIDTPALAEPADRAPNP
ncbi:MAG: class I SAM-dependent methyltransferase [Chakrabartia sp.]